MPPKVKEAFDEAMASARTYEARADSAQAWRALERAHILSQRWVVPHLRSHVAMLAAAWRAGDAREIAGQLLRLLLAAPGSFLDRAPLGNTGRANVGLFTPMPIPQELARLLDARTPAPPKVVSHDRA